MKRRTLNILKGIMLVFLLSLAACKKTKPNTTKTTVSPTESITNSSGDTTSKNVTNLNAPTNLSVDDSGRLTFSRVTDAQSYEIEINGITVTNKFANYDLLSLSTLPANGTFTIKVRAVYNDIKSDWSNSISYTYNGFKLNNPTIQGVENNKLKFSASFNTYTGITSPVVIVEVDGVQNALSSGTQEYDLSLLVGNKNVAIFVKGDGVYNKDSDKVKFAYNGSTHKLAFEAPKNVHMEGNVLKFDKVEGANIYYFKDVYNTVTYLSGSDINSLSKDLNNKFLVKSMWAGNTDLNIENSLESSVVYFSSHSGSEEDPFLITSASELRYIEYYESIGEAKYYKLSNDIEFENYNPQADEEYSNFYNLGSLSGSLDGDNHSIKNIVVYFKDGYSSIFDSITPTGVIKNLKIESTKWRTWTNRTNDGIMHEKGGNVAILTYQNRGLIENVTLVSGSVTAAKDGAAGLVTINKGTIKNCTINQDFTISGVNETGGFAIINEGTIQRCINSGTINGSYIVGGICGRNQGLINECGNNGAVNGNIYTGGIVGYNYNLDVDGKMESDTMVKACFNKGRVTAVSYVGGIAGRNGSDGLNEIGGTTKVYANAGIYGCYNQGTISGLVSVAGIAGDNFTWWNDQTDDGFGLRGCYSSGDINHLVDGFQSNRIYLSVDNCSWALSDNVEIRAYMWGSNWNNNWPGEKMEKTTIGGATFLYVDMPTGISMNNVTGLKFSRVSQHGYQTEDDVFNSTEDITDISGTNTAIYYISSHFSTASLKYQSAAAIATSNNKIDHCYAKTTTLGGTSENLALYVGGSATNSSLLDGVELKTISSSLNSIFINEEIFVDQDNKYPILKWEKEEN
ncbi:MAG: hypothetical protein K6F59_01715 [Gammaproteobacteria bacterium]|nr:hypothetical protein [Gammaproteobacteria bacterium]